MLFALLLAASLFSHPKQSYAYAQAHIWASQSGPSVVRWCESRNNYHTNTGNGYYGAYQFALGTWTSREIGGKGLPSNTSQAEQDYRAWKLWKLRGWQPWSCKP